jgi:peptidoglycan/xylan/chitin deacetylase (PgdA/CDA1 family)
MNNYLTIINNKLQNYKARILRKRPARLMNKNTIISFTFDDFPVSAYVNGGAILELYGMRATYYLSSGLMGKQTEVGEIANSDIIKDLISKQHEIGCHTYEHLDALNTTAKKYEESIIQNVNRINSLFSGITVQTFAYPRGGVTSRVKGLIEKRFSCCRGIHWGINWNVIDCNLLNSCHVYCETESSQAFLNIIKIIEIACRKKAWLILYTHDVRSDPSDFGCSVYLFEKMVQYINSCGAEVLPVYEVFNRYVKVQ